MRTLRYVGTFLGGFICAIVLFWFAVLPKERQFQFDYGFRNGQRRGQMDVADAIQKEFGIYDGRTAYKSLFEVDTIDLISLETNGIKTVRVIP